MYDRPFQITGNWGNNAFSFERRTNPMLHVPSLIEGGLEDVGIGDQIVFEDFDETDTLRSCVGLRNFVRMPHPKTGKPIVVVDNHNHVFYFWHEARERGWIQNGATLIHIDQHKDMRKPEKLLDSKSVGVQNFEPLPGIFEYTNMVLNVGNYIVPAMGGGLVGKLISVTSERELGDGFPEGAQTFARLQGNLILNIDLDFWAPEMGYIDRKWGIGKTREWMEKADLITIATSPFFIDQALAIQVLGELMA